MKAKIILALMIFGLSGTAFSADYYVDSQSGSDSSDGLTPQTAWQTLDQVNAFEFEAGDRVLFRRGGLWRGNLNLRSGNESARILYSAFGEGAKPRIYGSAPLGEERDWISQGDNLWTTRETTFVELPEQIESEFASGFWAVHTENGAAVEKSIAGKGCDSTIQLICQSSGKQTNHIQLINAPFKIERGVYYRFRFRASCDKPFKPMSLRLSMAHAPWAGYGSEVQCDMVLTPEPREQSIIFRSNATADDARLTLALGGLLPEGATLRMDSLRVDRVKIDSAGLLTDVGNIILDGQRAAFKRWTKEDLKQQDDFWYDIVGDGRLWYYSDVNPALKYDSIEAANMRHIVNHSSTHDVTVEGFDLRYGSAHGFGGTKAARLTIRDCDLSWIGGGDQYRQGGTGRRVRFGNAIEFWSDASDCLVEGCRIWEVYDAALTNQGSGLNVEEKIIYRNNFIWNCEYSFEYWNREDQSRTENILFENNACYNAGFGWGHVQRPDKNGRHLMVYSNQARTKNFVVCNNIFCGATESLVRCDRCASNPDWPAAGLTLDSNLYFDSENRDCAMWLGKTYSAADFDRFREACGVEQSGQWTKPPKTLDEMKGEE